MNPDRKYWDVIITRDGPKTVERSIACSMRPTLRETMEKEVRDALEGDFDFRLEEISEAAWKKRIAKEPSWVRKLVELREMAIKKPVRPEDLVKMVGTPNPGHVLEGWGIHLLLCIEKGEYHYALYAVRFDKKVTLEKVSFLNRVLLALGNVTPEPMDTGIEHCCYFYWKADLDPPVDA